MRIGDVLVRAGCITPEQLETALELQRGSDKFLGEILVERGYISRHELYRFLAQQLGIEYVDPRDFLPIEPELLELVPEHFAAQHEVLPLQLRNGRLLVACADPFRPEALEALRRHTGMPVELALAARDVIHDVLPEWYGGSADLAVTDAGFDTLLGAAALQAGARARRDATELAGAMPVVELIDQLLARGIRARATDVHFQPEEGGVQVRYRVDGRLQPGPLLPGELQAVVTTRLKIMAGLDIAENRLPQDGRAQLTHEGRIIDLRFSTFPTIQGEAVVIRLLEKATLVRGLEGLGFTAQQLRRYRRLIQRPHGIVLITGPTGSGKTTTLYSTLTTLDARENNICTIEDPVEYELPGVRQSQVNPRAGLTFATGLRSLLRQDPDVILVGEIRDTETMEIAIRAALTGHLVFSTLHTNDAVAAVSRLRDMGAESYLLASALTAVVGQRLVRVNCPRCAAPYKPDAELLLELEKRGISLNEAQLARLRRGTGCARCWDRGYRGRIGIFEVLEITPRIRKLILADSAEGEIWHAAQEEGMDTMLAEGVRKVLEGVTTLEEVLRATA